MALEEITRLDDSIQKLENSLGVPKGTVLNLEDEDDWSLVIKLHALIETAMAELITVTIGKPKLKKIFNRISMNGMTGKKEYLKALGVLSNKEDKYLERLSWIRNQFAHNVKYIGQDFNSFFAEAPKNEKDKFLTAISPKPAKERTPEEEQDILGEPSKYIWAVGVWLLTNVQTEIEKQRNNLKMSLEDWKKLTEALSKAIVPSPFPIHRGSTLLTADSDNRSNS